jgi:hypothetical protein
MILYYNILYYIVIFLYYIYIIFYYIIYHIILYYIILYSSFLILYYIIFYYIIYRIQGQHESKEFAAVYTEKPCLCARAAEALASCCYDNGIDSSAKDECQCIRRRCACAAYSALRTPQRCRNSARLRAVAVRDWPVHPVREHQGGGHALTTSGPRR